MLVVKFPSKTATHKAPIDGCSSRCIWMLPNVFLSFCFQTAWNMANVCWRQSTISTCPALIIVTTFPGFAVCSEEATFFWETPWKYFSFCSILEVYMSLDRCKFRMKQARKGKCVCECACGRMSVFMCGCFIQNISLCAWSVLTLAQGTRSVDKNCLVRVPRHEKWIWTKKCRLTAQAKSWQARGWWWVVGEWLGKAGDGRVESPSESAWVNELHGERLCF